ncbi:MAG: hypothetical protein ACPG5P_05360 [Saprospiraceae bacterium]
MENWEFDFEWLQIRHTIKDAMNQQELPTMNTILFLVGIQECGVMKDEYSKEEKQDLMHIAVCSLLSEDGYYEFQGRDDDGWPHFKQLQAIDIHGVKEQGRLLQVRIIQYFKER